MVTSPENVPGTPTVLNFADQLPIIVTVWEGVISPDTAFDFLGDSFGTIPLKGRLKTPSGKAEPFTVELRDTANYPHGRADVCTPMTFHP